MPINEFLTDFAQPFEAFLKLEQEKVLLDNQLKIVFDELLATKKSLTDIIKAYGFDAPAVNDNELAVIIKEVLTANPAIVQQYKDGKETAIGFFIGQVMKKTAGKANPQVVQEELKKQLK
jgi:aspartyl-tRNA(Asn)/glutamyl-tRNA(Gln) amidotransferase subunit B